MHTSSRATNSQLDHAIVIGGGMAGLMAARVLADAFTRVTLIERDELPTIDSGRAGVPQGQHAHALLVGGRRQMEALFPGLEAELQAAGAPVLDQGRDMYTRFKTGWAPRAATGVPFLTPSRGLVEGRIRHRVRALPNITLCERTEVVGLTTDPSRSAVTGVRLRSRRRASGGEEVLSSDLVVEASGRGSQLPEWLTQLGYARPAEAAVDAFVGYASRWYRIPEHHQADWQALWLQTSPPNGRRGAAMLPTEGGRWVLTLIGAAGDYPPTDEDGFLAFVRSLPSPLFFEAIRDAEPLGPIMGFRHTKNRLLAYDKLARRPEGLIVLGDAYCAFNPTYGQGMTVAALGAALLQRALRGAARSGLAGFAQRFQRQLAWVIAPAWLMATSEDACWESTEGVESTVARQVLRWYTDQVFGLVPLRYGVYHAFLEVMHMQRSPAALFHPRVLVPVLGQAARQLARRP